MPTKADDPTISLSVLIILTMPVTTMYDPGNNLSETDCNTHVDFLIFKILKDHDW